MRHIKNKLTLADMTDADADALAEAFPRLSLKMQQMPDFTRLHLEAHDTVRAMRRKYHSTDHGLRKAVRHILKHRESSGGKPFAGFSPRAILPKVRFSVFERDAFRCVYCGATASNGKLTIDHVLPVSKGGTSDISNLVTACWECNTGKATRILIKHPLEVQP